MLFEAYALIGIVAFLLTILYSRRSGYWMAVGAFEAVLFAVFVAVFWWVITILIIINLRSMIKGAGRLGA